MSDQQLQLFEGDLSIHHWQPVPELAFEDFQTAFNTLESIESAHQYWIGDALNAAKEKFGEEFTQLIPEGKEHWKKYMWVCESVPVDIRQQLSNYSQARTVAKLDYKEQIQLCKNKAAQMTARELSDEVKLITDPNHEEMKKYEPHVILKTGKRTLCLFVKNKQMSVLEYEGEYSVPKLIKMIEKEDDVLKVELKEYFANTLNISNMTVVESVEEKD